jgi:hypothetical protein
MMKQNMLIEDLSFKMTEVKKCFSMADRHLSSRKQQKTLGRYPLFLEPMATWDH